MNPDFLYKAMIIAKVMSQKVKKTWGFKEARKREIE
jgi:hypothetical protein